MLLRVGIAVALFAVALATVVAVVVNLLGPGEPSAPGEAHSEETMAEPARQKREVQELPVVSDNWPRPSGEEVAATREPRYHQPQQNAALTLTIEEIDLYDVPVVIDGATEEALEEGVIHLPQTPMPWGERKQKNVYLAGHRLGFPNTGSRLVFYNLDKLKKGDTVVLEDRSGAAYEYRVSEVFVEPDADWAVDPVRGRDMVTLQTCTMPDFENRLIFRANRAA